MPAKTKSSGLVKWDAELAKFAQQAKTMEQNAAGGGSFISTRGGQLSFQSNPVPGNALDVIIVEHILENAFYEGKFDPESPQPPVCFAFGRTEEDMKPHENSTAPQHATCKGCPQNEWGTAEQGRGKACKNVRRLALITEKDLEDPVAAQTAYLKLPVTSVKGFANYVTNLANTINRPPFAVVTNFKIVPDKVSQYKVVAELKEPIEDADVFEGLIEKHQLESEAIMFPYKPMSEEERAAPARSNGKTNKFAKKAKAATGRR